MGKEKDFFDVFPKYEPEDEEASSLLEGVAKQLVELGILSEMPASNQMSLFDM
ncbi:MAG: hypothetical protein IJT96_12135 [Lachnospiraceae bacterium]|nr:hypothetical protein [Lachnospiraceae bacterium]